MRLVPFISDEDITAAIPLAGDHLNGGGLLAYPTETIYGLGSLPERDAVVELAKLKGRPPGKPFLLLVSSRTMAEAWGLDFKGPAAALADRFWPGPLTLIVRPVGTRLPDQLRGPEGGIAVRLTSQPGVRQLIEHIATPITSTSANRPGQPPAPGAGAITDAFGEASNLMCLDGGVLGNVPPSTLVDCTGPTARLVRDGAIPRAELRAGAGSAAP